jgi:hypothetical protein
LRKFDQTGRTIPAEQPIRDHRRFIVAKWRLAIRSAASRLPLAKNQQVTQLVGQRLVIEAMSHQGAPARAPDR